MNLINEEKLRQLVRNYSLIRTGSLYKVEKHKDKIGNVENEKYIAFNCAAQFKLILTNSS